MWNTIKFKKQIIAPKILPACTEISLGTIGTIVDVKGDGNCGYYAIMQGLEDLGCLNSNISVTMFWKDLQNFGEQNATVILQLETYQLGLSSIEC